MSTRVQIPVSQPAPIVTHAASGSLQRKCTCGGHASGGGECKECKKITALQCSPPGQGAQTPHSSRAQNVLRSPGSRLDPETRGSQVPRFSYDFGRIRVPADVQRAAPGRAIPGLAHPSASGVPVSRQLGHDEDPHKTEYSEHGVRASVQSGQCVGGGGSSVCGLTTGKYKITVNNNTCCTKDCTQQHEQTHVTDFDASGCCAAAAAAYNAKGADKNAVVNKYNTWFATADPVSECHAYSHDVTCAEAMAKANDCSGKGKATDCCKDIEFYKSFYGKIAKTTCAAAAANMPACPTF